MFPLAALVAVTGCGSLSPGNGGEPRTQAAAPVKAAASSRDPNLIVVHDGAGTVAIRKVEFRLGVSSATVERLARRAGCAGNGGAGVVAGEGPIEVYRMQCDNGRTFLAKCELRQCRPMR